MAKITLFKSRAHRMFRVIQTISLMVLLTSLSLIAETADRQKITFAFFDDPNTSATMKYTELVYTDAFYRLNIDFSYAVFPSIRASKMADLGRVDGEPGRVAAYGQKHPNLIRIDESLGSIAISAYIHDPSININSWKDTQNQTYNIEYYRGIAIAKQRLSQYVNDNWLTDSSSPSESLRKLLRGRIDIYIGTKELTTELLATAAFVNSNILITSTLEEFLFYGYLHKSHSDLAIKLAEIFRQMKSEGKLKDYQIQAKQFIQQQK